MSLVRIGLNASADGEHPAERAAQQAATLAIDAADEREIGGDEHRLPDAEQDAHQVKHRQVVATAVRMLNSE